MVLEYISAPSISVLAFNAGSIYLLLPGDAPKLQGGEPQHIKKAYEDGKFRPQNGFSANHHQDTEISYSSPVPLITRSSSRRPLDRGGSAFQNYRLKFTYTGFI